MNTAIAVVSAAQAGLLLESSAPYGGPPIGTGASTCAAASSAPSSADQPRWRCSGGT